MPFKFICVGTDNKSSSVFALFLELYSVAGSDLELEAVSQLSIQSAGVLGLCYTAWLGFHHSGRRGWLTSFVQKPWPYLSSLRATYLCQISLFIYFIY